MEVKKIYDLENNSELRTICEEIKELYLNGDFIINQFQLSKIPSLKSSFDRRDFFSKLILTEAYKDAYTSFEPIDTTKIRAEDTNWLQTIGYFEEYFKGNLHWAGAYTSMEMKRAEKLSRAVTQILCPNPAECHFANLGSEWSTWFCNIAWDYSFIIFDTKRSVITIINSTDTD